MKAVLLLFATTVSSLNNQSMETFYSGTATPTPFDVYCKPPFQLQFICNYEDKTIYLHVDYRLFSKYTNDTQIFQLGHSIFERSHHLEEYLIEYLIYENITPQNYSHQMCDQINRNFKVKFCGRCKDGYAPSPYTYYGIPCTKCSSHVPGWLLYILLELGTPTVIFIGFIILRVRITSGMFGFIFYCQIISNTFTMPYFYYILTTKSRHMTDAILTLYGIWNMDFFRLVIPKFCVSEHLTTLNVVALGYISAFYPLLLTAFVHTLIKLHQKGCKLMVMAWKPFHRCTVLFKRKILMDNLSLTDTFATFMVLSCSKILFVSMQLLRPLHFFTTVNNNTLIFHSRVTTTVTVDPLVRYGHGKHLVYCISAVLIMLIFIILPALILCLYPYKCGRKILTKCRLTASSDFVKLVDAFQSSFKDGTNGTPDFRAVSTLYVFHRFFVLSTFIYLQSHDFITNEPFILQAILYITTFAFYSYAKPYKQKMHNYVEILLLCLLTAQCILNFELYGACESDYINLIKCKKEISKLVTAQLYILLVPQCGLLMYIIWSIGKTVHLRFSKHFEAHFSNYKYPELRDYTSLER